MNSLLKAPDRLFQMIEAVIEQKYSPEAGDPYYMSLATNHWHELPSGKEAYTEEQILDDDTAHCLAGWVVAFTPSASRYEHMRLDVDVYANEILRAAGREPIPMAIYHGEKEDWLKIIKRRAAAERAQQEEFGDESN